MPKRLLIVESPTKAKTITKFLGKDYEVLSSFGHVRDLPTKKTGVDVAHDFKPTYEVPERSKKAVADLAKAARGVDEVYLATDEDREGEAIAWHVAELLGLDPKEANRVTFHEITKGAIDHAVEHPRKLDMNLVNAQQARRILDRLVGYELSPFLWKTVQRGLSAGRVQSVAVRLIVERERERLAFKMDEYWTIDAIFAKDGTSFEAKLFAIDGKKVDKLAIKNEGDAKKIIDAISGAAFTVGSIERKQITKTPPAPFTTSTLQMEANSRLGMSAKQTMTLAQKLYETGQITYMRTDSLNLAEKFLGETQAYVKEQFGAEYATGPKTYRTKTKGAQEAHEAIRPTEVAMRAEDLPASADAGMKKLYDLIWRRAVASQLPSAKLDRTAVDVVVAKGHAFRATGNTIAFDGYMKVYHGAQEKILPDLKEGDAVETKEIKPEQHFTEPPPRYSDATLVKTMEEFGIGRPSTYAPTISTVIDRGYVERDDNKKLYPTEIALIVTDVLTEHFPQIVDFKFTANMEESLDDVAEGKKEWVPTLREFYGPFHETLESKSKSLKREDVMKERVVGTDPKSGLHVIAKNGRFGPFVQLGEWSEEDRKKKINKPRSASLMKGDSIDTLTLEAAMKLLELPRVVGKNAEGEDIIANTGRFGPYLKAGKTTVSLPPEYDPRAIDEAKAIELLANATELKKKMLEPIATLGTDPATGNEMLVKNGRFGPYLTDGKTNVSVPKKIDPKALTAAEAIELLAKKRVAPKRAWGQRKAKKSDE